MALRIVVCIKQILDTSLPLYLDASERIRHKGRDIYIVNPADRCALEAAVIVKRRLGNVVISALSVGPPAAEQALYYCLAQGADEGIHILNEDYYNLDSLRTSFILSKAIRDLAYDLILCGNFSLDSANSLAGVSLAELLGLPQVTDVVHFKLDPEQRQAMVQRRLEKGKRETLSCALPAVFTIDRLINEPHYVSLHNHLRATKRTLIKKNLDLLWPGPDSSEETDMFPSITGIAIPKPYPKRLPAIGKSMSVAERQTMILQGVLGNAKQTEYIDGAPDEVAAKLVEKLETTGILSN
jgi:electron transfer flavoprotein beta subunit